MKLKVKLLDISAEGAFVALLHIDDATILNIKPLERVYIKDGGKDITAVADIAYSEKNVKPGEIGLFRELIEELNIKKKDSVDVKAGIEPQSVMLIKKKLDGGKLSTKEVDEIIGDILSNSLTEVEAAYFVAASYVHGLNDVETTALTKAIIEHGGKLHFNKKPILDKHCIGGVPGNRTTMLVVPIIAAAGFTIPKTSTKSITSPAGTANTMNVLSDVEFSIKEIMSIVHRANGCMVWGGTKGLASVDDRLIRLEKPLSLDPEGFLLSSVLAKKSVADASHVLIDIPVGKTAKVKDMKKAKRLQLKFVVLGKKLGMKVKVIITDGSQPIGNGVGPALEARDVLLCLQNKGPSDLTEKSVYMAGQLLKMADVPNAEVKAREILTSGLAYEKMKEIIRLQGGNPNIKPERISVGKYKFILKSKNNGKVVSIDNINISHLAKMCGAPTHKGAGLYLHKKVKDAVEVGDSLVTFYAEDKDRMAHLIHHMEEYPPLVVK